MEKWFDYTRGIQIKKRFTVTILWPLQKKWEDNGADLIHVVDLDATLGLGSNLSIIKKILENISIPVEVAGGLRDETIESGKLLLSQIVLSWELSPFKDKELMKKLLSSLGKRKNCCFC